MPQLPVQSHNYYDTMLTNYIFVLGSSDLVSGHQLNTLIGLNSPPTVSEIPLACASISAGHIAFFQPAMFSIVEIHKKACSVLPVDNTNHFVICSHPLRLPLKIKLISSLRQHIQTSTYDPILSDIVLEGINSAITNAPFPYSLYPLRYHCLLRTQTEIRWINLLHGFVSTKWNRLHDLYLESNHLPSTNPGPLSCLPRVVDHLHQIWQFRNAQRHSATLAQHQTELLRQAHVQVRDLYQYKHSVLPTDRHIFYDSLPHHLTESLSQLQAWLHNHSHYILQSHQQAQRVNTTHTRPLTHYFSSLT